MTDVDLDVSWLVPADLCAVDALARLHVTASVLTAVRSNSTVRAVDCPSSSSSTVWATCSTCAGAAIPAMGLRD